MNEVIQINLKDAKQVMLKHLIKKLGDKTVWLSEFDEIADWFTDNKRKGLLLIGGQGVGKTFICKEVVVPIIMSREYGIWKNVISVDPFNIGEHHEEISAKGRCPVFFDDIGMETPFVEYGNTIDPFPELVYRAEAEGKLLILTTNKTWEEIEERYKARVTDRLRKLCRIIEFKAESFRK